MNIALSVNQYSAKKQVSFEICQTIIQLFDL